MNMKHYNKKKRVLERHRRMLKVVVFKNKNYLGLKMYQNGILIMQLHKQICTAER